ncbi:MAG TPA: phosphate starvation-inducible protein PhoH [Lentisphaeria bacterium]|nr:MAG: hypothetical protein A2X47_00960 [Lentisphaerae bacterium GWF2_38_69]HBM17497.1 phosphate starvation-inducible protein PhoH [Lentisphaeria bacterium]
MLSKELHLDSSSVNAILAGDIVRNISTLEQKFDVKILSRGTLLRISSKNQDKLDIALVALKNLIKFHESGHHIKQKDFEIIISNSLKNLNESNTDKDFHMETIKVGKKNGSIIPRTQNQYSYVRDIQSKEIVFGIGPAGTGKTYLAMALAISAFLDGKHTRIILTRPAMEAGENLGFLPGTLEEKIKPYLRPLYDALYDMLEFDEANRLLENNIIEVAPLAFMRGRTLNNSFIILDEAQNTTVEQMMMFLTRIGFESKCVITGDPSQTDLPHNKRSGLNHACSILKNIDEISIIKFNSKDVVRNPLIEKIITAYEQDKK